MRQSILIIGPDINTCGIGGVTIHVKRLKEYLDLNGIGYGFADYKTKSIITIFRDIYKHRIVHLHISNPILQFTLVLLCALIGKKVILTLHGNYGRFNWIKNQFVRLSVRFATIPIAINTKSYEICNKINSRTQLIPAFIPPQKHEVLQKEIMDLLLELRSRGKIIVSTNAFNIAIDSKGNEIYGIDFLISEFLQGLYNNMVLVISDPTGNYARKYNNVELENIYFINYPHSYFEVLKYVDYFVRNTSTDGDALSVKEALYLGVPTICSDVVDRPKGVRLFKYCDRESFHRCFEDSIVKKNIIESGVERIAYLYTTII